jgi:hypothetical protein
LITFEFCKFVELVKLRDKHFMEFVAAKAVKEEELESGGREGMKGW